MSRIMRFFGVICLPLKLQLCHLFDRFQVWIKVMVIIMVIIVMLGKMMMIIILACAMFLATDGHDPGANDERKRSKCPS